MRTYLASRKQTRFEQFCSRIQHSASVEAQTWATHQSYIKHSTTEPLISSLRAELLTLRADDDAYDDGPTLNAGFAALWFSGNPDQYY